MVRGVRVFLALSKAVLFVPYHDEQKLIQMDEAECCSTITLREMEVVEGG